MEAKDPIVVMREAHAHAQDLNQRAKAATTTLRDLLTAEELAELNALAQAAEQKTLAPSR